MKNGLGERKTKILIFIFFLCVAVFCTWPLLINLCRSVYGEVGDPVSTVWELKWVRDTALSGHGGALRYPLAGYPGGINTSFPLPLLYMPLTLITYLPRGETILYNLIILVSMALNGFVMYLLGMKMFKNRYASLGMGLIYIFCPYALARARVHFTLVEIFIFPLVLYALLKLKEDYNNRNKLILFITLLLAMNIHPYYTCMLFLMLAMLFIYYIFRKIRRGGLSESLYLIRDCVLLATGASLVTGALMYIQFTNANEGFAAIGRREGDLYSYAAHAWSYYMPSPRSILFGGAAEQFIASRAYAPNIEEYILFLGYTNMGLALVGLVFWVIRRWSRLAKELTREVKKNADWVIPFVLLLGVLSFLFSLQPVIKIGGATLYTPSWFIYKIFPFLRVYSRFGVLVFFSVTLASGACLAFLARAMRKRGRLIAALVFVLILALALSEYLEVGRQPMQALYEQKPPYTYLQELPDDTVIVEYPFVACDESFNSLFLWNQFSHGKSMLNGYALGTEGEAMRLAVLDILDSETPGLLAYMGAEYATVHRDMYMKGSEYSYRADCLDLSALPGGLEVISNNEDSVLLKVNAERPDTVVQYDPRCSLAYLPGMNPGLWLQFGREWSIAIDSEDEKVVDIEFNIYSIEGERDLEIAYGPGVKIKKIVGNAMEKITLEGVRLAQGENGIYLSTEAEEVPFNEVFGGHDSKPVSFVMSFWHVEESGLPD